jgi:hypothetical protein
MQPVITWKGRPDVRVVLRVLDRNASGLLTGFSMLAKAGAIRLTQQLLPTPPPLTTGPWHLRDKDDSNIEVHVDGRATGFIDLHDSWELNQDGIREFDVYLKRSLDPARHPPEHLRKLVPLGLIYEVWANGLDLREASRILVQVAPASQRARDFTRYALRVGASWVGLGPRPNVRRTSAAPDPSLRPRVLFMVGLWDPSGVAPHDPSRVPEFEHINSVRMECIRMLREALPDAFYGGAQHSAFAKRIAPGLLLPDGRASSKRRYLAQVRRHAICVATMGLHGSNGCKLAEYVSLSRAVISERLRYVVPGDFAAEQNYLPFETPEQCVAQALRLVRDDALRGSLMRNNWDYYNRWLRPDALAAHVVRSILERR